MRKLLVLLAIVLTTTTLWAQRSITGKVTDEKGNPIPNASVIVRGTSVGTTTLENGTYILSLPANAKTLVFSSVGMTDQEIVIGRNNTISISLSSAQKSLDEVVVVSYGTRKKSEFVGSASTLSSQDFAQRPVSNVVNAIAGSGPGIQTSATGQPGDALSIRIRGYGSISAGNGPLIIVDGSPYEGNLSDINPRDVETVTTLKDAATTALYGSRAANGILMITTRNGSAKKPTLNFMASRGWVSRQIAEYDRVNPFQYYPLMWEALKNARISGSSASTPSDAAKYASGNIAGNSFLKYNPFNVAANAIVDTNGVLNPNAKLLWGNDLDWTKEISRTGKREEYGISYSGGSDKTDFYSSVGYTNEQGYAIDAELKKYSGRVKVNTRPLSWFKTGFNAGYTYSTNTRSAGDGSTSFVNPFFFARTIGPIYPVYSHDPATGAYLLDALGNRIYDYGSDMVAGNRPTAAYGGRHVVAETKWNKGEGTGSLFEGRTYVEISPIKELTFTASFGGDLTTGTTSLYQNNLVGDGAPAGILDKSQLQRRTFTFTQMLNFKKTFGDHNVSVLAAHENYDYYLLQSAQEKQGQSFTGVYELDNFLTMNSMTSGTDRKRLESYFSTANYDYKGKYILSLSGRRDGNSRFAPATRWQNFWGLGLGWQISKEDFFQPLTWVNSLKLRSSYGSVGNDDIGTNYAYQATYLLGFTNAGSEPGALLQSAGPNPSVTWEENKTFDVGADFTLFKGRINGSVEWYQRNTNRMLFLFSFPPSAGGTTGGSFSEYQNIGNLKNTGLEIDLHADIIRTRDFTWNVGVNASTLKNTITKMPPTQPTIVTGTKQYSVGHSIYDYWLRQYLGVDPANGNALYRANNTAASNTFVRKAGDTVTTDINNAKKYYAGTAIPDLYGGISTSVRYKDVELSVRLKYQLGGKTYDATYAALMGAGNYGAALHVDMLKRWQKPGDITNVPRLDNNQLVNFGAATSDRWLTSASFLNFENVTLLYNFRGSLLSKIHASGARIYLSADNLGSLIARKGMNPNQTFSGVTSYMYLPARIFSTGINLNF